MPAAVWRDRAGPDSLNHGPAWRRNQVDGLDPSNLTFGDIIDANRL
jgi:hypothetical protein